MVSQPSTSLVWSHWAENYFLKLVVHSLKFNCLYGVGVVQLGVVGIGAVHEVVGASLVNETGCFKSSNAEQSKLRLDDSMRDLVKLIRTLRG